MKHAISILALLLAPGLAYAEQAKTEQGRDNREAAREFKDIDINKDGYLSEAEIRSSEKAAVDVGRMDLDGDGRVEFGEFARFEENVSVDNEMSGPENSAADDSQQTGSSR